MGGLGRVFFVLTGGGDWGNLLGKVGSGTDTRGGNQQAGSFEVVGVILTSLLNYLKYTDLFKKFSIHRSSNDKD